MQKAQRDQHLHDMQTQAITTAESQVRSPHVDKVSARIASRTANSQLPVEQRLIARGQSYEARKNYLQHQSRRPTSASIPTTRAYSPSKRAYDLPDRHRSSSPAISLSDLPAHERLYFAARYPSPTRHSPPASSPTQPSRRSQSPLISNGDASNQPRASQKQWKSLVQTLTKSFHKK